MKGPPLHILTFLHSFEPGGVERIALRLVRHWRDAGIGASLFMGRTEGAMAEELASDLSFYVPRQPSFTTGWCETLWMMATLPRFIRRRKPDVLFCAGNSYAVVAVAMKLILGARCPPILAKISNDLDRHDMIWPVRRLYGIWLRIQGHFIDHFVGMEEPMEAEIKDAMRPRSDRITIIPDPALSLDQIKGLRALPRQAARPSEGRRFVAVGRLARQKNFALMIRAFARGSTTVDSLVILGDGPQRAALESLVDRLGLRNRVSFAGHVPDPARRLAAFDCFLLSSHYEGVPAVLVEALAVGLPIIATQCSRSIRAMMGDGTLARIVPAGDEGAFARAIADAGIGTQDSHASLRQARRYTIETASIAYLAAFASMIESRRRPRKNPCCRLRRRGEDAVSAIETTAKSSL